MLTRTTRKHSNNMRTARLPGVSCCIPCRGVVSTPPVPCPGGDEYPLDICPSALDILTPDIPNPPSPLEILTPRRDLVPKKPHPRKDMGPETITNPNQPPFPPMDTQTPVKTLLSRNFVDCLFHSPKVSMP